MAMFWNMKSMVGVGAGGDVDDGGADKKSNKNLSKNYGTYAYIVFLPLPPTLSQASIVISHSFIPELTPVEP